MWYLKKQQQNHSKIYFLNGNNHVLQTNRKYQLKKMEGDKTFLPILYFSWYISMN